MDLKERLMNEKSNNPNKSELKHLSTTHTRDSLTYNAVQIIGSGSFGVVYQASCIETDEIVAIKKVFQDRRYKNRELQILKELNHPNVIKIKQYFYTPAENGEDNYLNVVMDYYPETLSKIIRENYKNKTQLPMLLVKLYAYQIIKAIHYIHSVGICHRDIKPQNILIDPETSTIKICDFGSAKKLVKGDVNVAYICSRYYRAPELIFGSTEYTNAVDIWSVGCVIAELVINQPLFPGENSIDQLVEIIKVLGTPTKEQIHKINPLYKQYKFPFIKSYKWSEIFKDKLIPQSFIDLLKHLLIYEPEKRMKPLEALTHPFFDELREQETFQNNYSNIINSIFYFTVEDYNQDTNGNIKKKIIPDWFISQSNTQR
jgi:glycogen synthase kinase 3 beta